MPSAVTTYGQGAASAFDIEEDTVNATIVAASIAVPTDVQSVLRQLVTLTTTVLAAAAVYTGPTVDAIQARRLTGMVTSDQAGTLDIQCSDDATTWYTVTARVTETFTGAAGSAAVAVAAAEVRVFEFPVHARYVRVRYTNGATLQGSFRLSAYLSAQ